MTFAIETLGLAKSYGNLQALAPITLNVRLGACFGLLGPNGAGKSTLVKTLLGIVHATGGGARLLGKDAKDPESRRSVGYLPEGHRFPRYLTGLEVCRYFGKLSGLGGKELDHEIAEKLEIVGMSEWQKTKITRYSKGMMQRVGLAQAMLGNPQLIFLDEPTDGVDPVGRQQMREVIRTYAKGGRTIFLNSHLLSEVELVCDEIAILNKGRMITHGSVTDVKANINAGRALRVKIQTSPLPEHARGRLAAYQPEFHGDDVIVLTVKHRDETTTIIDLMREAGANIYAVTPIEGNLEDAFIRLILDQGVPSVGGERS